MNCGKVKNNLLYWVEGTLPEKKRLELEAHLAGCETCARLVQSFSSIWGSLDELEHLQPSPFFWNKLERKMAQASEKKFFWNSLLEKVDRALIPAMGMAILVLGIVTGNFLGNHLYTKSKFTQAEDLLVVTNGEVSYSYNFEVFDDFPAESFGKVYLDLNSQQETITE